LVSYRPSLAKCRTFCFFSKEVVRKLKFPNNSIVSRDTANRVMQRVVVLPLTSAISRVYPAETVVTVRGVQSKALADQITAADKHRLKKQAGELTPEDMQKVDAVIRLHLDL
jgi:mRNA interferase MazF